MNTITIQPIEGITTLQLNELIIACSLEALCLQEADYPPVIYFPFENILQAAHVPTDHQTHCPYKGEARYFSVREQENKAWIYYDPLKTVSSIGKHVAYYSDIGAIKTVRVSPPPEKAKEVLTFWFEETPPEKHYKRYEDFDSVIRDRYAGVFEHADEKKLEDSQHHPQSLLALVILLDQFSRNIFRDDPRAFAQDEQARAYTKFAVQNGFDLALPPTQRAFVYLPLMHSENLTDQNQCVALFQDRLPGSMNMPYALSHRTDIHQYGRFPYRDDVLKREN
ncbi:MAG: DUF924 family protein [Pseudomonadota bacterium]